MTAPRRLIQKPNLTPERVKDVDVRSNLDELRKYFDEENQLLGFKFVGFSTKGAVTNLKIAHGLGAMPRDLLRLQVIGDGEVTFNRARFTSDYLDISTTDAVRVRLLVGAYHRDLEAYNYDSADTETWASEQAGTAAAASGSDGSDGADGADGTTTPPGVIEMYGGPTAPDGYLMCDGSSISRSDYPALFAAIGTVYGAADASHFNVPNMQGVVPRGTGFQVINTRTKTGPSLGELQEDQFQGHYQRIQTNDSGYNSGTDKVEIVTDNTGGSATGIARNSDGTATAVNPMGVYDPITDGVNGDPRTGEETRVSALGLNFIIKT